MSAADAAVRSRARLLVGSLLVTSAVAVAAVLPGAAPAGAAAATTTTTPATPKVCADAAAFDDATKALAQLERGDLAAAAAAVHEATGHFADGAKKAPAGIAPDYKLMAKALTDLDAALTKAAKATGDDQTVAISELLATVQRLDADPALIEASGKLQQWILEKCNETLSAVDPYSVTTTTTRKGATTTRKGATTTRKVATTTRKGATTTRKGATTTRKGKAATVTTTGKTTRKK